MGQRQGKASYVPDVRVFLNLSKEAIDALWEAFNDIAEGFGLSSSEFQEIVAVLDTELDLPRAELDRLSSAAFRAFDSDENGLVDALEFLATFALSSGMSTAEKVAFAFNCYDFDESGELTIDEMTLSMKSTLTGLAKLSGIAPPSELKLEAISQDAFAKADKNKDNKITKAEFTDYCTKTPEVVSWIKYYDDPPEQVEEAIVDDDSDLEDEGTCPERSAELQAARDDDPASLEALFSMEEAGAGDEFMAVKPWVGTVENTVPSEPPPIDASEPDSGLDLEFVHGYRGFDTRNNVRYNAAGKIVYHAAAIGIIYDAASHSQKFHFDHTDDVLSLAMSPDGTRVATGEVGKRPKINVWDAETGTLIRSIRGFHRRGVCQLAFSPDGRSLLSVGLDDGHSLAIYDVESGRMRGSEKTGGNKVLAAAFADNENAVTCGVKHILFWRPKGRGIAKKKGLFGRKGKLQTLLCLGFTGDGRTVSGTVSGHLYLWAGRNCKRAIKAHDASVTCLYTCEAGLVSGGKDGKVKLWSPTLEPGASFDMAALGSALPRVRSVAWSADFSKLLVGTKACELFELSAADGSNLHAGPLVQGHYKDELWGLAVHPTKAEYVTVGDDKTVRVWDVATRKQLRSVKLDCMARAAAYNPAGTLIAVGLGGRVGRGRQKKDGAFVVLREEDLSVVYEGRDSKQWIEDIKFSPDGMTLAVTSHDNNIYLYNVDDFASKGKCRGHNSYITHVDFSSDSASLQSTCGAYELLFWDAATGEQRKSASSMRDVDWATWTLPLGWPVQGIWPAYADGTDINAVDRSASRKLMVTADDFGKVKLFRYPAPTKGAGAQVFTGHSSHVTNARFSFGDEYVLTVGGNDKCVFQWRNDADEEGEDEEAEELKEEEDGAESDEDDVCASSDAWGRPPEVDAARGDDFASMFAMEEAGAGDEFMAVKPWVGAIVPPTAPPAENPEAPAGDLELEWVHGYRSQDCRNNIRYAADGAIVYHAAALGIRLAKREGGWSQSHMLEHGDDIVSFAMHPSGRYVATGEMGKRPRIIVWDCETQRSVATLQGAHRRAVSLLHFSKDGRQLASVGADDNHTIAIYDWESGALRARAKGHGSRILDIAFSPDGSQLLQVGVKHGKLWTIKGRNMSSKKLLFGRKGKIQALLTCAYVGDRAVIGTADGHLYTLRGRSVSSAIKAHTRHVSAIYACDAGLVTGGKDGLVKLWSAELEEKASFDLAALGSLNPQVRSVAWDADAHKLLVGTKGSEIYELSDADGSNLHDAPLVQGHYKDELWGLAVHPTRQEFCTVGDDKTVRIWDIPTRRLLRSTELDCFARAVAYSPDGSQLAIGLGGSVGRGKQRKDGAFVVLAEEDLSVLHEGRDSKQWISDVKYSPDGATLAVGSHDNAVYLYDAGNSYSLKGKFRKHNSYITHLDWSADSQYLQTNCGAYELLFSDGSTGEQITSASSLKDTEWATWTCTLGWPVQGIWPAFSDGTDINAVDRSHDGTSLVTADDFGKVKLWNYPVASQGNGSTTYPGHSSHVTNARFAAGDRYVLTTGGNDQCVFQWRVERDEEVDEAEELPDEEMKGMEEEEEDAFSSMFAMEEAGAGDEFMAVKPWLGAIKEPSAPPAEDSSAPDVSVELDFVHGYRARGSRNNLRYNCSGDIVYHAAGVGIVYSSGRHAQKFHIGHDDDIVCLDVSPDGRFVATGQMGRRPVIRVWDSQTANLISTLPRFHRRAVLAVAFNKDGTKLASVGQDDDHSVAVWSTSTGGWEDGKLMAREKGDKNKTLFVTWTEDSDDDYALVTGGVKHVKFWKLSGRSLSHKKGLFGRKGKIQPVLAAALHGGNIVTSTASGHLYVWKKRKVVKAIKAHSAMCAALFSTGDVLVSGGKDGMVRLWDAGLNSLKTYSLEDVRPAPFSVNVRSVALDALESKILVGTEGSEILEISKDSGDSIVLIEGHFKDELWGLAVHPLNPALFATSGDDKTIRVWDVEARRCVKRVAIDSMTRALAYSPDGTLLAAGLGGRVGRGRQKKDGGFIVLNTDTLEIVHEARDSKQWIQEIKFSPDGRTLAVGSHDNAIYLYDVPSGFAARGKFRKHNSYITHLDFSADSAVIQSNCGAYELLFSSVADGSQITSATSVRDTDWATWTCVLGWPVQGIWPAEADGTDINAVCRSEDGTLLATSDDFGKVRVFRYPVVSQGNAFISAEGHSSHVTNVRFTKDSAHFISTGGNDRAVFQWRVV